MRFLIFALFTLPAFAEWPQFRGNPSLTGIATGQLPPENLKLLWTWEGGESFESSPVIAGEFRRLVETNLRREPNNTAAPPTATVKR